MRRDFTGIYQCEGCNTIHEKYGCYDDDYFHEKVMPDIKCTGCGQSSNSLGVKVESIATKYKQYEII